MLFVAYFRYEYEEIVAYDLALRPNLEQISRMLEKAFKKFTNLSGLIFHSDQGWQYQHNYFRQALKEHGIIQSMSRKGNCYDNSVKSIILCKILYNVLPVTH